MRGHLRVGVDVTEIRGDAGRADNVEQCEMADQRVLLEQQAHRLPDAARRAEQRHFRATLSIDAK